LGKKKETAGAWIKEDGEREKDDFILLGYRRRKVKF